MGKYVNITTDMGFKAVFGDAEVTRQFLNALFSGTHYFEKVTFLDKELKPLDPNGRTVIYDLLCRDENGIEVIIEMQNYPQRSFIERGFYYLCRAIEYHGVQGDWDYTLRPVYGVYFMNFALPEFSDYCAECVWANKKTGKPIEQLRTKQIYISLPLFNLQQEECATALDRWIFTLKNMDIFEQSPFKEEAAAFERLLNVANVNALDRHERAVYEETLKNYRDWRGVISYAAEEGEERGRAKGIEMGREEGLQEGLLEGKRLVAANLKKQGIDIQTIAECTGLSVEEINAL